MIYVASRTGAHHEICEDAVLVGRRILSGASEALPMPEEGFICIADGVGGNNGGAAASRYVLQALSETAERGNALKEALAGINQSLIDHAKATPEARNMATTLTGICRRGKAYKLIHIGNTRAYIKQGRYLKQITSDHTTYNWLKSSGRAEAAEECNKNEITNCFGGADPSLLSKLVVSDLPSFSMMVFTSDGVHEYVDLDALEEILFGEGPCAEKCEVILNMAKNNGSEDDMTIAVIVPEE